MPILLLFLAVLIGCVWAATLRRTTRSRQASILSVMRTNPKRSWTPREIASYIQLPPNTIAGYLESLSPKRVVLVSFCGLEAVDRDANAYKLAD